MSVCISHRLPPRHLIILMFCSQILRLTRSLGRYCQIDWDFAIENNVYWQQREKTDWKVLPTFLATSSHDRLVYKRIRCINLLGYHIYYLKHFRRGKQTPSGERPPGEGCLIVRTIQDVVAVLQSHSNMSERYPLDREPETRKSNCTRLDSLFIVMVMLFRLNFAQTDLSVIGQRFRHKQQ